MNNKKIKIGAKTKTNNVKTNKQSNNVPAIEFKNSFVLKWLFSFSYSAYIDEKKKLNTLFVDRAKIENFKLTEKEIEIILLNVFQI